VIDTAPLRGIIDTSVFLAHETGRPLDTQGLPAHVSISVVSLAELEVGVLLAADVKATARRLVTLDSVSEMAVLHIDEQVARHWALLRAELAQSGRRINVNDIWIAATAIAHDLPVVTQDTDFDAIAEIGGLSIVRV